MPPLSAGILLYRRRAEGPELLLIHPGGPFWRNKDDGAWMIPKGMVEPGEDEAAAALREFEEELGTRPAGSLRPLCRIRQKGGKWVQAFLLEGDFDPDTLVSNSYLLEWPPKSGRMHSFPEVDRAAWFTLAEARIKILPSQEPIIDAFEAAEAGSD
ncbi:MAG: NUDIX domain-containing protein [Allosphingosinicella sp.]